MFGSAETLHIGKHRGNFLAALQVGSMIAPGAYHYATFASQILQPLIILRPDWVIGFSEIARVRRAKSKQIGDGDAAIAPLPRE